MSACNSEPCTSGHKRKHTDNSEEHCQSVAKNTDAEYVKLMVGGTMFETTLRSLCSFEGSFLCNYYGIEGPDKPMLTLDFDPKAFSVALNALRAGVKDIRRALEIVHVASCGKAELRDLLDFLGLEWLMGISVSSALPSHPTRMVPRNRHAAEELLADSKRFGLFHHLFTESRKILPDRYAEDSNPPADIDTSSIVFSHESHPDDERQIPKMRTLELMPWYGLPVCEELNLWLSGDFVFDIGIGNTLRLSGLTVFISIDTLDPQDDLHTLVLEVDAASDWEKSTIRLMRVDLVPRVECPAHTVCLDLPLPPAKQQFIRMLRLRVLPGEPWGERHQDAMCTIQYIELFGDFISDVPRTLLPMPRGPFMFDASSASYEHNRVRE